MVFEPRGRRKHPGHSAPAEQQENVPPVVDGVDLRQYAREMGRNLTDLERLILEKDGLIAAFRQLAQESVDKNKDLVNSLAYAFRFIREKGLWQEWIAWEPVGPVDPQNLEGVADV